MRLSSSALRDERWSANNFANQRIKDVLEALKWLEQHDIAQHNVASLSTARLAMIVTSVAGGKKAKANINDFLPFDTRKLKKDHGVTSESLDVLRQLVKTQKMNGKLIGLLAEELKMASNRNEED